MAIKAETGFSLKDQLFNRETVGELSTALKLAEPTFKAGAFKRVVFGKLFDLELKQRIHWIVECLDRYLPENFDAAVAILTRAMPPPLDPALTDGDFGKFIWVVPGEYVARYGCTVERLDRSLSFLREATKRFSSESAIRPFLKAFPDQTMAALAEWVADENYHVRRLVSEGTRPLLPWADRVVLGVSTTLPLLDQLHADNTRYVTRSVANHLNDLSKSVPDQVIDMLRQWQTMQRQKPAELAWTIRHALRTLARTDHEGALDLLGYSARPAIDVTDILASRRVQLGEMFSWRCVLTARRAQKLRLGLAIDYLKANGTHSRKVFSIKDLELARGASQVVEKRVRFAPATTRILYPGTHHAELLVNGKPVGHCSFVFAAS